eukprot:11211317-Lingulodinium_polyedra.AAC.1
MRTVLEGLEHLVASSWPAFAVVVVLVGELLLRELPVGARVAELHGREVAEAGPDTGVVLVSVAAAVAGLLLARKGQQLLVVDLRGRVVVLQER